jgi:thymidylate kinase/CYTH domain-containing protein
MAQLIKKIVLTGGPCAGKTSALTKIEETVIEKGYRVFIIPESATELINGGIRPFGNQAVDMVKFQELILKYQLQKEKMYEEAIKSLDDNVKCILLCDRGTMDNKAYITNEQFNNILNKLSLKEANLLDNYDMIIHLVTAADGKEEYYTLANNGARTETIEQAIKLDRKTINSWVGHNNLIIIDNSTEFDEKLQRVMESINNLIGEPITLRQQQKYTIDLNNSKLGFIKNNGLTKILIDQTYLETQDLDYEIRLRKKILNNDSSYFYTVQKKYDNGLANVITDKKINYKEYEEILNCSVVKKTVKKDRYCFVHRKQYFKLDIFDNNDIGILEIEAPNKNIIIPYGLKIISDVTNNKEYQNSFVASIPKKQKAIVM